MTERLLQYIWQFQYFNTSLLVTEQGETLQIIYQGQYNTDQGPDFLNAKIVIGTTTWMGNVELHITSSDWNTHRHTADANYGNIILHVVWQHDVEVTDTHGTTLPTLQLDERVPKVVLTRYESLMHSREFVPSQPHLPALSAIAWLAWKERLVAERLQRKSTSILNHLKKANNHWEEVFWWLLARSLGARVNADIFESVARSISINILAKHKNQIHQLECILFGQAGLLGDTFTGDYPLLLQREYRFLQKKYRIQPVGSRPFFLRMRPANFPTLRLAQLAMIIYNASHLFTRLKEADTIAEVMALFTVTPNDYWQYHYMFDDAEALKPKPLGKPMMASIIINTVIPVLFAYGSFTKTDAYKEKAIRWLVQLPPESNNIVNKWQLLGVSNANALESQALIELKQYYCDQKRCLECAVGNIILKGKTA